MVRLTDRPAMTIAVDLGLKATKQTLIKKDRNREHFYQSTRKENAKPLDSHERQNN